MGGADPNITPGSRAFGLEGSGMTRRLQSMIILILFGFAVASSNGSVARAATDVHERMKRSVIYLKLTGKEVNAVGEELDVSSVGTGFVISPSGLVLTTYHLIGDLGKNLIASSVIISGSVGTKKPDGQLAPVSIVDASIPLDLLLVRLKTDDEMVPVALENAETYADVNLKEIFTLGFPKNASTQPESDKGIIKAQDGLGGNTWSMNITPEEGASGSPIYGAEGRVIGIIKGESDGKTGYFIPIELAASMIAHVKLHEMSKKLEDYNELRRRLTWEGQAVRKGRDNFLIQINYRKWVRGEPQVAEADFIVEPFFQDHQEVNSPQQPIIAHQPLKPLMNQKPFFGQQSGLEGFFEMPELWDRLVKSREAYGGKGNDLYVRYVVVTIKATLTDGTILPDARIKIDIEKLTTSES
jgi:S1-C subfamily serine protease